ncbi:hypothetical protein LZC95_23890 [Pendulispora brunnea]|uniref:Lipoprotein n=1 Tax=Pendulispora brunnea TaxID=2905690 RepID=A0ABZ2KP53_9BACT
MVSFRTASIALVALGLMACASEGRQPRTAYDPSASYDPSSLYTPSPNYRPLAVNPPTTVTGVPGNDGIPSSTNCTETAAATSANRRLCP